MSQVQQLYRLQQMDNEIRAKKQRLTEVISLQKETEVLIAARTRMETAVAEYQHWQSQQSALNLELGTLNDKAKRTEKRLYSGKVTNPKELHDLQKESAVLGRRRDALEEGILEAMIMIEDAQAEERTAESIYATEKGVWDRQQAQLREEQGVLAVRLHDLLSQRQQRVPEIDPKMLKEYETLGHSRGGVAVAGLKNNACLGCRIGVSVNKARQAERGELVYCGGCGRILVPL